MRIYRRELRTMWKSLAIWTAITLVLIVIAVSKFKGYYENPELLKVLDSMPKMLLEALGMTGAFSLATLKGFYAVMFIYFALMGAMAAAMWGNGAATREELARTADFTLVLPLPRGRILLEKFLAALTMCVAFPLVTWAISIVAVRSYSPDPDFYRFLRLEMLAMFLIELIFLALGFFLGCFMKSSRRSGSAALVILLAAYFLSILQGLDKRLDFLKHITPFKYFEPARWAGTGRFEPLYLALTLGAFATLTAAGFWAYSRRDIAI